MDAGPGKGAPYTPSGSNRVGANVENSVFDAIVADFYKAATGAMEWDRALDGMQAAFSARTAILQTADVRSGQILCMNHGGPPLHDGMLEYVREFHRCDPRRAALFSHVPEVLGQWWHCHEHFDGEFVSGQRDRKSVV